MTYPYPVKIAGIGRYLPGRVVPNRDLEAECGLESGWCESKLGVTKRHWADSETQSLMGAHAAREALSDAGIKDFELDLILNASLSFEQKVPDGGPLLQKELGLEDSGIPSFTVQAGCQSFLAALDLCGCLLATARYRNILIVASEVISDLLDPANKEAYCFFGDGAGAVVVTAAAGPEESCVIRSTQATYTGEAETVCSKFGLRAFREKLKHPQEIALQLEWESFREKGLEYTAGIVKQLLDGYSPAQIRLALLQQFSAGRLDGFNEDQVWNAIVRQGLCGAASYPLALYEAVEAGRLNRGDLFLMAGVGDGMIAGGMLLKY
jgi:3-oxoacyl-[acyl-carrier-protein] synthase-3